MKYGTRAGEILCIKTEAITLLLFQTNKGRFQSPHSAESTVSIFYSWKFISLCLSIAWCTIASTICISFHWDIDVCPFFVYTDFLIHFSKPFVQSGLSLIDGIVLSYLLLGESYVWFIYFLINRKAKIGSIIRGA